MLSKTSLSSSLIPRPFLKWAGGKGKLVQQISDFFPESLIDGSITRYVEPFIGGGAMLFYIASNYHNLEEIVVFDINPELILAYQTIKQDVDLLGEVLLNIQDKYWSLSENERKKYFYQTRELFNSHKKNINYHQFASSWIERTAQIIFLNRTCFNGLFRVNSQGYFNVPMGKYNKPKICNLENLRAVSLILQKVNILLGDFTKCREFIDEATFVYFDPPYRPISKTANFTAYSESSFNDSEQLRLRDFFSELDSVGSKLLLSNSDPKNENQSDNFFEDAYRNYRIERIQASRNINSKSSKRGLINELLIMNY
ncbi:MAG: Dam family site-specific DNA-(adenine-N6)-methyltransferase [Nostocaceae cyanobacterium]|nr:Dam family site-specific DNA-(adenine-N6)-methyltransferase [Nostocaceae cyanobacterium]